LIEYQKKRFAARIRKLVEELYGGEEWPEGTMLPLPWPSERKRP
jgi:hypothetical protein